MKNVHGIVYAYHSFPELRELGAHRTGASLPFCGRYRLIDIALSSLQNAGIHDVGVIMQKGYQSLMDHLGSGKTWDMARKEGGMNMLPPYGLPDSHKGVYEGTMEALSAIRTYIADTVKVDYLLVTRGDLCANIDMEALTKKHMEGDADITCVVHPEVTNYIHHRVEVDENGFVTQLLSRQTTGERGYAMLETYMISRKKLLEMIDWCAEGGRLHFHKDALQHFLGEGWKIATVMHEGFARHITCVSDYWDANMDMLDPELRAQVFPADRPVSTRERSDVSTYYAAGSKVRNSLVADGCVIEGELENCIVFGGVKVGAGSVLHNCIIMHDTVIGENVSLNCVISDKNVKIAPYNSLKGNRRLPIVIPKGSKI
ncbi:MAG: glucose-1-phosphate adenylyltransferase subunit GlgD [Oscillospiraceae bacterium]|nr:glucose-1-phosphate adenylyltransferase subunit GlgD [Oscillospiraceae bacterium]